jgi:hypothetical protein
MFVFIVIAIVSFILVFIFNLFKFKLFNFSLTIVATRWYGTPDLCGVAQVRGDRACRWTSPVASSP